MSKLLSELPHLHQVALMHKSKQIGKTPLQIIIEGVELWFEKDKSDNTQSEEHQLKQPIISQEQTVSICSSQIDVIPASSAFGLLLDQDNGYLIANRKYQTLESALIQIKEYEKLGSIILSDWNPISGEYPLVILQKAKGTPHIWLGQNTACKIFNNPIMKPRGFILSTQLPTQNICKVCARNYQDLKSPRVQLLFDHKKRLLPSNFNTVEPLF